MQNKVRGEFFNYKNSLGLHLLTFLSVIAPGQTRRRLSQHSFISYVIKTIIFKGRTDLIHREILPRAQLGFRKSRDLNNSESLLCSPVLSTQQLGSINFKMNASLDQ